MHEEAFKITSPERGLRDEAYIVCSAAETEHYQAYRAAHKKCMMALRGFVTRGHGSELTYTNGFHAKDLDLLREQGILSVDEFAAHTGAAAATGLLKPIKDKARKAYIKACKAYDAAYLKACEKLESGRQA
jgi:hypothetical protein